jgi:hypothetical protein
MRALVDREFAQQFSQNPEQFREEYNLTDEDIETISEAGHSDVSGYMLRTSVGSTLPSTTLGFTLNYYGFKL